VLAEILRRRVSAIIRTNDQELAAEAMRAAVGGGFRVVEFTLTTPGALELIAEFAAEADLLVGAGTVMSPTQAREARAAGAKFLVSPVCDPQVIAAARALDVVSIPGTFTPTEMLTAHRCGADMVKLFPGPADAAQHVAAILGPMPYLRVFPTAGVTLGNFLDILKAGAAGVGFVKPLFEPADLAKRDFAAIEQRAASVIARLAGLSSPAPGSN
jgi:Entner-Doudoroff aldolase